MARLTIRHRLGFRFAFALLVVAAGWGAFAVAQGPGKLTTYAGYSSPATALFLVAGLGLALAGLFLSFGRTSLWIGELALLAGFIWFAPIYVGWHGGPPLVRSIAMLVTGFTFPVLLHLALAYPSGGLRGAAPRLLVWIVYAEAALIAVGRALFRDPFFDPTCWANCTDNVFLLRSLPELGRAIDVIDRSFTVGAAVALGTVCIWRLLADSAVARRALFPVATPAILLAASVAAHAIAQFRMPFDNPSEPVLLAIFLTECAALILLAAGLLWTSLRTRLQRREVARIVANLGEAPRRAHSSLRLGKP